MTGRKIHPTSPFAILSFALDQNDTAWVVAGVAAVAVGMSEVEESDGLLSVAADCLDVTVLHDLVD